MPPPPLPDAIVEMLEQPNPAVIGTVRPDGAPSTVPTWYLWDDGKIVVSMDAERRRLSHIRRDPRVSLTVLDEQDWGTHVSMRGRMSLLDDNDLLVIDRIAQHYTGKAYEIRDRPRVTGWIEIEAWHAWGRFA
ncbi:PPOX class F420-dependent oxidoreductase [Pseudonocardia acidicola]|uniref:PPOX class F420-dependent oxidoreductase n=1 Tax=Pseudonocardia acidicola TaxID=2724939 RepID=A0ABX1S4D9_9PSEU|nr:PPOX class F420-dependent oxidoreductase [Pseudonocardia acidicola]NMH95774.1 PPOX class F420-dependent oxidoreductase [Pseudonocardia acidicola]